MINLGMLDGIIMIRSDHIILHVCGAKMYVCDVLGNVSQHTLSADSAGWFNLVQMYSVIMRSRFFPQTEIIEVNNNGIHSSPKLDKGKIWNTD